MLVEKIDKGLVEVFPTEKGSHDKAENFKYIGFAKALKVLKEFYDGDFRVYVNNIDFPETSLRKLAGVSPNYVAKESSGEDLCFRLYFNKLKDKNSTRTLDQFYSNLLKVHDLPTMKNSDENIEVRSEMYDHSITNLSRLPYNNKEKIMIKI